MIIHFLSLIFLFSCSSSKPTPFKKEEKKEGYRDETYEELKIARFKANRFTKKEQARLYAEFRAIENCHMTENKHANMLDIFDKSIEQIVTKTSGSNWGPSYGFGSYPYYSRYPGYGVGIDVIASSGTIWNEKVAYPIMEVYYNCRDFIFRPKILFKEISPEQMDILVKDFMGGMQVEKVCETSPNFKKVQKGDVILKANGKRIEKVYELVRLFETKDSVVILSILREGRPLRIKISAIDVTSDAVKTESEIITKVCKNKKNHDQKYLRFNKLCL
jgi:hypothetical protein